MDNQLKDDATDGEKLVLMLKGQGLVVIDGGMAKQAALELTKLFSKDAENDTSLGLEALASETQAEDMSRQIGVWETLQHLEGPQAADNTMRLFYAAAPGAGASEYIRAKTAIDSLNAQQAAQSAVVIMPQSQGLWSHLIETDAKAANVRVFSSLQDLYAFAKAGQL